MDFLRYISLLVVLFFDSTESGGHKEDSHDHIKIHVPEVHHHKHHTKYITIHHHHKKPKENHHHHHHHHVLPKKPHFPHHHYYHKNKGHKTVLKTTTVGKHHGHHHHHHEKNHGHKHHVHHHGHGHGHGHHHHDQPAYDPPAYEHPAYDPPAYGPPAYGPPAYGPPAYDPPSANDDDAYYSAPAPPPTVKNLFTVPKVHGVTHTVKKVKVFDSLPGVLPPKPVGEGGYEVTENTEEEEDSFEEINNLQNIYPSTYNFIRTAGSEENLHDPFSTIAGQTIANPHNIFLPESESFAGVPNVVVGNAHQHDPFAPTNNNELQPTVADVPFGGDAPFGGDNQNELGFNEQDTAFVAPAVTGQEVFLNDEENINNDITPVTFQREAGIQQSVTTGGHESVVY